MAQPNVRSLGVLTPGIVRVSVVSASSTATNTDLVGKQTMVHALYFQAVAANTGQITISERAGNAIAVLNDPAASGPLPEFNYDSPHGVLNGLVLDDFYVVGSGAGDKVLVTFQQF